MNIHRFMEGQFIQRLSGSELYRPGALRINILTGCFVKSSFARFSSINPF